MAPWLDAVLVLLILTSLWLLGSSRLQACIQAVAFQGMLLGLDSAVAPSGRTSPSAWPAWPSLSTLIKAVVLPAMLRRAVREANVRNEVQPLVGFTTSLLLGIALWGLAMHLAGRLPRPSRRRLSPAGSRGDLHGVVRTAADRQPQHGRDAGDRLPGPGERHLRLRLGVRHRGAVAGRNGRAAGRLRRRVRDGHHHAPPQPRVRHASKPTNCLP